MGDETNWETYRQMSDGEVAAFHGRAVTNKQPSESIDRNRAESLIDEAYHRFGYATHIPTLGWSLLACPWARLIDADVALITLNPGGGGKRDQGDVSEYGTGVSGEEGCAYVIEDWGHGPGKAPLQQQIQRLFEVAKVAPADVLCGYLVPFRSPDWVHGVSAEALKFGKVLWGQLFGTRRPALTFTLGRPAYDAVFELFGCVPQSKTHSGWGDTWIRCASYEGGRLIGLPHLSRFRIFGHIHARLDGDGILCDEIVRHVIWDRPHGIGE